MINSNCKALFIFLVLLFSGPAAKVLAQHVSEMEKKYTSINSTIDAEQSRLDSLNNLLADRAGSINKEKKKKNPDKERITDLMSNSILLSNQISELRKKIVSLENKREELKDHLRNTYNKIIDSLNTAKMSGNADSDTDLQILSYSEKKLSIAQKFRDLSFNPEIIISVNPSAIKNPDEKKIFADYIKRALSETNEKIRYVDNQYNEITEVITLQRKAEKFIEETEYSNEYRFSRNKTLAEGVKADYNNSRDYIANAENAKVMLNQFRTIDLGDKTRSALSPKLSNLSLKDYQKLLKELKDNLIAFRTILTHKSQSFE